MRSPLPSQLLDESASIDVELTELILQNEVSLELIRNVRTACASSVGPAISCFQIADGTVLASRFCVRVCAPGNQEHEERVGGAAATGQAARECAHATIHVARLAGFLPTEQTRREPSSCLLAHCKHRLPFRCTRLFLPSRWDERRWHAQVDIGHSSHCGADANCHGFWTRRQRNRTAAAAPHLGRLPERTGRASTPASSSATAWDCDNDGARATWPHALDQPLDSRHPHTVSATVMLSPNRKRCAERCHDEQNTSSSLLAWTVMTTHGRSTALPLPRPATSRPAAQASSSRCARAPAPKSPACSHQLAPALQSTAEASTRQPTYNHQPATIQPTNAAPHLEA